MTTWIKITEERYDEMLGMLRPAAMTGYGFLVGEPSDHNERGQPRFKAFVQLGGQFFESQQPLTRQEFSELRDVR